jgi:Flp pilus assembly CpaE family ATPase
MENVARVVLALDEHDVAEEVMHFLDRAGGARIVATAVDERQLAEAVRQLEPDAVVASPSLLRRGRPPGGRPILAVDTRESVGSLRAAIRAGAHGFYLWPEEREELAAASRRVASMGAPDGSAGGRLIAVLGSRGGAGTTFVATHLAAAFARRGRSCILVDVDTTFDDLGAALSIPLDEPVPTLVDMVASDESGGSRGGPWTHPAGFRVIPGSAEPAGTPPDPVDVAAAVDAMTRASDVVVAHLPRVVSEVSRAVVSRAHEVVLVLTLDVASFRAAKRAIAAFGLQDRCRFVVNRTARADVAVADVQRVFGRPALAAIPSTSGVRAAQDRGRLLPPRGRAARVLDRTAVALLEPVE